MKNKLYILTVLLISITLAWGQGKISSDPEQFLKDIEQKALLSKEHIAKTSVQQLRDVWTSPAMTEANKKRIIGIIRYMHKSRISFYPNSTSFMNAVYYGAGYRNFTAEQLEGFLKVASFTFKNQKKTDAIAFFKYTVLFLSESKLSTGTVDKSIIAKEGDISFEYNNSPYQVEYVSPFKDQEIEEDDSENNDNVQKEKFKWGEKEGNWNDWSTVDEEEISKEEDTKVTTTASMFMNPILPDIMGPTIIIKNTDLVLKTKHDFTTIYATDLYVNVLTQNVIGSAGSIDWKNAGLPEVKAEIAIYSFNARYPHIIADGVKLIYPEKIEGEVVGLLEYKSTDHLVPETAIYPRFVSYVTNVKVLDLAPGLEFHGGFGLKGSTINTGSISKGKGTLFVRDSTNIIKSKIISRNFTLKDSVVVAIPSRVTHYFGQDSIVHTGVKFKYEVPQHKITLQRGTGVFKYTPYNDPLHSLDINGDELTWNIQDTVMHFSMGSFNSGQPAYFSSMNYFNYPEFFRMRSLFPFHPVAMINQYRKKAKTDNFYAVDVAKSNQLNESLVKKSCQLLSAYGYIDYDPFSSLIIINEKMKRIMQANRGKRDYDVISIKSISPPQYNATLNLNNNILTIYGAQEFLLSDSNNVRCFPKDGIVKILPGHNMEFDGTVRTSSYVFNGTDFKFDYEKFTLDLIHIDSIKFDVVVMDSVGGTKRLSNKLSYSAGILQIDGPKNKSGLKDMPAYPIFEADKGASVLFNGNEILGGAYDTTIQYKIPPFKLDSLTGDISAGLQLDGDFSSGGIFPDFKELLEVQGDLSFGFKHDTPKEEGYPLYKNEEMRFYGKISMSNKGLRGNGYVKYLNTTLYSSDFVFFPDSVLAIGDSAITTEGPCPSANAGVTFPQMDIDGYQMKWYPKQDSMAIGTFGKSFEFYDHYVTLMGVINISKKGAFGSGIMSSKGARTISEKINYSERSFVAHSADFEILSNVLGKPAMRSDLVKVEVNIDKKIARFSPESERASNEFPFLSYKTSLNEGIWYIDQRKVEMELSSGDSATALFYSTRARQDSIHFSARKATYLMDSLRLYVSGVDKINIADAAIIPKDGNLVITKDARILEMQGSRIEMDTTHAYHQLINCKMNLLSTSRMVGTAIYKYVNSGDDTMNINFSHFEYTDVSEEKAKEEDWNTFSEAKLKAEDKFYIAPQTLFKGSVKMYSQRKALVFDGEVALQLTGTDGNGWIPFFKDDDSKDIVINLESSGKKNDENPNSIGGFYFDVKSRQYYGKFLGAAIKPTDQRAFGTSGALSQDYVNKVFTVGDTGVVHGGISGKAFTYKETQSIYHYIGDFDLLTNFDTHEEEIEVAFAGEGEHYYIDSTFDITGICAINYIMPSKMYETMALDISEQAKAIITMPAIVPNDILYRDLSNLDNNPKVGISTKEAMNQGSTDLFKFSKKASAGIVFNKINLLYDKKTRSWYSKGDLHLSNINKTEINAIISKGYVEINKGRKSNKIQVYLEIGDAWYYLNFSKNSFSATSSNQEFNTLMLEKVSYASRPWAYFYKAGKRSHKNRFLNSFKAKYLLGGAVDTSDIDDGLLEGIDSLNIDDESLDNGNTMDSLENEDLLDELDNLGSGNTEEEIDNTLDDIDDADIIPDEPNPEEETENDIINNSLENDESLNELDELGENETEEEINYEE